MAGKGELALAGDGRSLDEQDVAAHRRPGETGRNPRKVGTLCRFRLEARGAEAGDQIVFADLDSAGAAVGDAHRRMAQDGTDLALEIAHARLAGVAGDDPAQRRLRDAALFELQSVLLELARDQVANRNLDLFGFRVAREPDDLHAVEQRTGHGIQHVRGSDEDDPAEIEGHAQIVVAEGGVLGGIQHLEQGRGWIALDAAAQLVDLIQHHHAVARPGLADRLDDVAGQGADIGAPVAADFRLVMDAAQADPGEFALHGARDALAQRGLAHARRTDEAEDGRMAGRIQFAHGEILDDPLLDLVEPAVILVQHLARLGDIDRLALARPPGQLRQPLDIAAQHGIFGRVLGHPPQALQLLQCRRLDLGRHAGLGNRLGQLADVAALFTIAQLLLDRIQLLAQNMLALAAFDGLAGALADIAGEPQNLEAI